MNEVLQKEEVVRAIARGIEIEPESDMDLFLFGEKLIEWINRTPNNYWVSWDYQDPSQIVVDVKTMPLLKIILTSGKVQFSLCYEPFPGDEDLMAPDIGNVVIGVCLFCKIESGAIEQLEDAFEVADADSKAMKVDALVKEEKTEEPDFEWI